MNPTSEPPDAGAGSALDADHAIPTLTEVVHLPRYSEPELPATLSEVDWASLAQTIQDNVLGRLMRRSEPLFGAQLRATLKSVLDRTAEQMSAELQVTLSQLTRDLVANAVAEELTRVHAQISGRSATQDEAGAAAPAPAVPWHPAPDRAGSSVAGDPAGPEAPPR